MWVGESKACLDLTLLPDTVSCHESFQDYMNTCIAFVFMYLVQAVSLLCCWLAFPWNGTIAADLADPRNGRIFGSDSFSSTGNRAQQAGRKVEMVYKGIPPKLACIESAPGPWQALAIAREPERASSAQDYKTPQAIGTHTVASWRSRLQLFWSKRSCLGLRSHLAWAAHPVCCPVMPLFASLISSSLETVPCSC